MIANAIRFGAGAAVSALLFMATRQPLERCWPLDSNPGAWACIGAARPPEHALAAELVPQGGKAADALTDEFRRAVLGAAEFEATGERLPTPDTRVPLPPWMPAGVLSHEATIRQAAADVGIDPLALAVLVAIECPSGNTGCTSYAGARGLAQVMPATAAGLQAQTGYRCAAMPYDPLASLQCGASYYAQGLRAAAALWAPGREANAIGAAGIGYNSGNGNIPRVVAHVRAGGSVCSAPAPAESLRWCSMAVDMWRKAGRN